MEYNKLSYNSEITEKLESYNFSPDIFYFDDDNDDLSSFEYNNYISFTNY